MSTLKKQTGYRIMYNDRFVKPTMLVSIDVDNQPLEHVLDQLLGPQQLTYHIKGKTIALQQKETNEYIFEQPANMRDIQEQVLSGTVTDANGAPLAGVTVRIVGTNRVAVTDDRGGYRIQITDKGQSIAFSAVGFETFETSIDGRSIINVSLTEVISDLEEVVVVGYGTVAKGDLTGSISSVQGADLASRSVQQLSTAMQGQIAGVQVTRSAGGPGAAATVRIRGITTLSNNDPLVIVDGVPSSLNDVIAADVETMTVLKDAASASIYGSRAAAGVILITTKRAKGQQFSLDYNTEYAFDRPTAKPTNGNVIDWMNVTNEIRWNDSGSSDPYSVYSLETIDSWLDNNAADPWHYPNTDWVDLMLKKSTAHQQHSIGVTGGTEKLLSKFNFTYQDGDGYYAKRSYERFSGRLNNDYKINDWLDANIDVDFSKSETINPAVTGLNVMYRAYQISPYYNAFWEDGRYADVKDGSNHLAGLNEGGQHNDHSYRLGGKAQLNVAPLKGLKLTAIFAPRFSYSQRKNFVRAVPVFYENGTTTYAEHNKATSLSEARDNTSSTTYQLYGNYQNKWGDHSFNAMAGYEGYAYKWEDLGASRNNYLLDTYPYLNIGPEDYQYNSSAAGHNAYESVFSRIIYSYKNKYMLQGNIRSDGSSRFAKKYRWGTFYSGSAGWVVSEESWFKNNVVDFLKIRGSIGQLGNERIGSEFPYQAAMVFGNSYMYDKSTQTVTATQRAAQTHYAFENITWETSTTYGAGLDLSFLNRRLRVTGDYYYKKTANMLLTLGFPSYAGFSAPSQNAGDMHTKGWDLELGWSDNIGDFWYSISANLSDYRSRMGYLGDRRTINGNYIIEEGSFYNEWFMYRSAGLFQTSADLNDAAGNKYPTLSANDKAGDIKYVDVDGNGTINSNDKVRLGNSLPEYLYGGNISLGWKAFDFNLSFQGIGQQKVLFNSSWIQPLKEQWGAVPSLILGNYWSQHNSEEENLKAKYPRLTYNNTANTYVGSDYWLFNGGYFRVKNITLGYTLPSELMNKVRVNNLRLFLSMNDLPAVSNYPRGWDPEVGPTSEFISTSFILGLNVKF
ncbi:TonB-dependent receptor [Parapedobacter soli]|uniref:TonB-dependent receptor n=1 Tax=Parapedobacter soli TaxID=416955 RepID=UPI0021C9B1E9|nr:TonB-dependent receptor [Parapedobacter soli]